MNNTLSVLAITVALAASAYANNKCPETLSMDQLKSLSKNELVIDKMDFITKDPNVIKAMLPGKMQIASKKLSFAKRQSETEDMVTKIVSCHYKFRTALGSVSGGEHTDFEITTKLK
jgi:hypothetical protein